jgi:hypothetical protein
MVVHRYADRSVQSRTSLDCPDNQNEQCKQSTCDGDDARHDAAPGEGDWRRLAGMGVNRFHDRKDEPRGRGEVGRAGEMLIEQSVEMLVEQLIQFVFAWRTVESR